MRPVIIGRTVDRSVIGIMVDFAKAVPYHLGRGGWNDDTLQIVEERLAETPCHASRSDDRVIFPDKKAPDLLCAKWLKVSDGSVVPVADQLRGIGAACGRVRHCGVSVRDSPPIEITVHGV